MHGLLFVFVLAGNVAAVRLFGMILLIAFFYHAFMAGIVRAMGWRIGRRRFIMIVSIHGILFLR